MATKEILLPARLRELVEDVGASVSSNDIDGYARWREIEDRSYRLRTIVEIWEKQQQEERSMRRTYAMWLLFVLLIQMIFVNAAFFLIGFQLLKIDQLVANIFVVSVFGEIAAMVLVIVKYLFPQTGTGFLQLIEKL